MPELPSLRRCSININGSPDVDKKYERTEYLRHKQLDLDRMLVADEVDWDAVRSFQAIENMNPNHLDSHSRVATIHRCAYEGQLDILKWCLEAGADVNLRTSLGRSALHYACNGNKLSCIRLLLERGADVNVRNLSWQTPLHFCCIYGSYEAALELLHGTRQVADIDVEDSKGQLPEQLTSDKRILRAIRKYRDTFDDRRRADLIEQALMRIFRLFQHTDDVYIMPEDLAECQSLLAQHFPGCGVDQHVTEIFLAAGENLDLRVSWDDFKKAHLSLIESFAVGYQDLMKSLSDLESSIFTEVVSNTRSERKACSSPHVTPRAKDMALKRAMRPALHGAYDVPMFNTVAAAA